MADVSVTLTSDEALVLFDWLATVNEDESVQAHPSVHQVLWNLEAGLEAVVSAVVAADYRDQLAAARARLTP